MIIDPAIIIAFITAVLALLGLILRLFISGQLMSRNVVPREDFERVLAINEGYAAKFGEQTATVAGFGKTMEKLVEQLTKPVARRA